ncbi:MAG: ABC transporter ATP-binding protein [Lachnospiraceae bacterium]|nr:ABC transporter ATP-binding protein [Lachnospiraceae bacterium]
MGQEKLLEINHLNIEFHDHALPETVVEDFSLSMTKGEILGIVGESGSGKTMSALAVAGLLNRKDMKKSGEILFGGENLLTCERKRLREFQGKDISVIFQEPMTSLNPVLKIGMQIEESLRLHTDLTGEERRERALSYMREVELKDEVYDWYPHELSGGMRQRAMIAAAMVCEPALLIADEPTTALDVTVQEQIIELLLRLNKEKQTAILFISHDLSLVKKLCHRVIVMEKGKMVEEGETEEVFLHPKHPYTRQLISAIPKIEKKNDFGQETGKEADETAAPLLKASNLNVFYRTEKPGAGRLRQVLFDVSLEMKQGEILGLVGESGSGKSTLAKAIIGLNKNIEGELQKQEGSISMIFQDPYSSLNPAKKVGWILQEVLRIKGGYSKEERLKAASEIVNKVGLDDSFLDRYPRQLSGGQRQRISIAIALLQEPLLLIADEPVSALDVTIQAQIIELLKKLQKEMQLSILLISHDLRVVYGMCDRVMVLKDGCVVEEGVSEEVYSDPKADYTKELLQAAGISL